MEPILDPRSGDLEDDASSTHNKSLLALAGTLLAEISLPRLAVSWLSLLFVPGLLLGAAPIAASAWFNTVTSKAAYILAGLSSAGLFALLAAIGWFGWRPLFRLAESSFWSLHSLVVQPVYVAAREILRHFAERVLPAGTSPARRARLRAVTSLVAGLLVSAMAGLVIFLLWPTTHLLTGIQPLRSVQDFAVTILSNGIALIAAYLAAAALVWAVADALMPQPQDLPGFAQASAGLRSWRVAHMSDIHMVGEPYGFRIESGRSGPQGNARWTQALARLDAIHAESPIDLLLITGDMTDAGRSAEWVAFQAALADHPALAARALILPGNHDVNIVDRANPARLDLPYSPNRRLRLIRTISAMAQAQGARVRIVEPDSGRLGGSLNEALAPHIAALRQFAGAGSPRFGSMITDLWNDIFPMVQPPATLDGLGVILLNSNAASHFSFTNALGMVSAEQARRVEAVLQAYPDAVWIIGLHHHLLEYPRAAKALSERIGTALINGNWFVRKLQPYARQVMIMHGHRHIDWIGGCAALTIVSAPSPVMAKEEAACFYIHTLAHAGDRQLRLLAPQRIAVAPAPMPR
jgi:hypothetical protein